MDGRDVRPVSAVVGVLKMNELHMECARQVGQLPGQDHAAPGVAGFGDLEFVFGGEARPRSPGPRRSLRTDGQTRRE